MHFIRSLNPEIRPCTGKRIWKREGCKGVEAGGEVQLKWEKELELRGDTMGVGEKWVKYVG